MICGHNSQDKKVYLWIRTQYVANYSAFTSTASANTELTAPYTALVLSLVVALNYTDVPIQ